MSGPTQSKSEDLFEIAEGQQGYFSARQATEVGYKPGSRNHHVKAGNWRRVEHGIYRLARFPQSDEEQLVVYSLWLRNRAGRPEGAYSHQTALSLHGLSDANPARLHVTVPLWFRRTVRVPKVLVLHRGHLSPTEVEQRHGFRVTRPFRTVIDLAKDERVPRDIIAQALAEGRRRGLITLREITDFRRSEKPADWFAELLSQQGR